MGALAGVFSSAVSWVGSLFPGGGAAGGVGGATAAGGSGGFWASTQTAVVGSVGGTAGGSTFIGQVANAAFQLAVSTALSVAFQPNMGGAGGQVIKWRADPNAGVPYVFGVTGTGGTMAMKDVYGGEKARHFHTVSVLSIGPIEGIDKFYANDVETTFAVNRNAVGYYHDVMWRDYKLGNPSETAHEPLTPPYALTLSANWKVDHKLSDLATAQWVQRYNHIKYSTGPAQPLDVVLGPAAYDPREDSSVPGGSGTQDSTDRSTWSFAGRSNPFLQAISWGLGITVQGEVVMGVGAPLGGIDVQAFIDGANVCEANNWEVGGVALSTDAKFTVLEQLLRAGGGRPIPRGGKLSALVQAPRVSIATLTGADVLGMVSLAGAPGRRERFNTVIPRYREPDRNWEFIPADPVSVAALVTEDGGKRSKEILYPYVQNKDQAAQLARYDIWDSREAGPWEMELRPRWRGFKPGDCFTLNEPELGWDNVKLLVRETTRNPTTGRRVVKVWTETDAKHADALGATGTIPAAGGFDTTDPGIAPPDSGTFTATGGSITYNGAETPVIFIDGAVDSVEASDLLVRYRVDGSGDPWEYASWPVTADKMAIATVGPAADYEVEYNYRSVRGPVGETWTPDVSLATTGNLIPQDDSITTVKVVDEAITEGRDQQVQVGGFGGVGAITIAYQGGGANVYTQLDEYSFTYGGEGVAQVLWIGCVQWQANSSKTIKTYLCVDGAPSITLGYESGFEIVQTYNGNQNALTSTIAMAASLTGLSPGAHTIKIYGKCDSSSNQPYLDVGAITKFEIGKK